MKQKILGLLVGGLALAAIAAPSALAAKVSVEVEGLSVTVAPTVLDTPATVAKGGQSCPGGDNVLGALDVLTKGDWDGSVYGATRILGEDHPLAPNSVGWVFTINGKASNDYGCGATLHDGDKLLWYASKGFGAYVAPTGWGDPVLLDAPAGAVPGRAFTVAVTDTATSYDSYGSSTGTALSPSAGATVSGGTAAATTGADGKAQVTVAGGPYTLVATKGDAAPARIAGCATTGSDGFCGTVKGSTSAAPPAAPACVTNGHDGFCGSADRVAANAAITAVSEGKKYKKGRGPRQLAGKVAADGSGLADVRLRLTRTDAKACSTYDARTEKFKTMKKCGATHGLWFSVGAKPDFTYLLPSRLGRGRYVLDVEVVDKAGNKTLRLARGTSRVVFTVA
ncbi:MAG: hypothetical protein JWR63_2731 [Conexibacter sp.]|nr:hypothetical protein [Conexibacter sp.]